MVDYVEDPIGRIVGVHWGDDEPPPPHDLPVRMCGTYSYGFRLDYTSGGSVQPIPTGDDGDPWLVRNPNNPNFGENLPYGLTLGLSGIVFGAGQTRVLMTPETYTISTAYWDITNTTDEQYYGLLLIHTAGPRDYNRFPYYGIPTSPQPYEPFFIFGNSLSWTYKINPGENGQIWQPTKTGSGANDIKWDDPSRFDPNFGGDAWIRVLMRTPDDPVGLWRDIHLDAFWRGSALGPQMVPAWLEWGDPPIFHPGSVSYGQNIVFEITSTCLPDPPQGARHEDPLIIHDDGSIGSAGP